MRYLQQASGMQAHKTIHSFAYASLSVQVGKHQSQIGSSACDAPVAIEIYGRQSQQILM